MKKIIRIGFCFILFLTVFSNGEIRIIKAPASEKGHGNIAVPKPTTGSETEDSGSSSATSSDAVQFLNGDTLHGVLQSIDAQTGVRWQHPEVKQMIEFLPANIAKIKLQKKKSSAQKPPQTCAVRLTNRDELLGNLVSLDAEKLNLDTWYAGKVAIQRKMVQSITPMQGGFSSLYEGPTGLEGWTSGKNNQAGWKYENSAFITARPNSLIGRDFKLPAMSSVEFEMAWRGQLQFIVCIYTDSFDNYYASNSYILNIQSGYVYMQRVMKNGGQTQLGQAQIPSLNQKSKARISIYSNKEKGSISLLVDSALVQQWKDPAGFAGQGGGVLFVTQGQSYMKLTNIRVSEWDGKFEDQTGATTKTKEDVVKLVNNDKVSGALQTIRDGKISFQTSYATVDIPMERVASIEMAGEKAEQAKRVAGEVRASFAERGNVTLLLERWDNKQVIGSSQNFGKLQFAPEAFQAIQFNLDKEKPATETAVLMGEDVEMNDE